MGMLNPRELRGVIGHELSHVYNRDILISSVAGALGGIITFLANLAWFIPIGRSDDDDGPGIIGVVLMLILGPLAAAIIQMAISRSREYQADASGASLTRRPAGAGRRAEEDRPRYARPAVAGRGPADHARPT